MLTMRQLARAGLLTAVIALALSGPAEAAMWLRISADPASPWVGQATRVTVLTLVNYANYCVDDPSSDLRPWSDWHTSSGEIRFDLKAFLGDRVLDIPVHRRESDPAYWDGEVVFPSGGEWTMRMTYPLWSGGDPDGERCAGARTSVTVRPFPDRLAATSTDAIALRALAGAALGAVVVLLLIGFIGGARSRWLRRKVT